jgi:hypothetical protein
MILICGLSWRWRAHRRAGGDDQRPVRSFQRAAQGRNSARVLLTVSDKVCEVVIEGCVDDCIAHLGTALEARQVFEIALVGFGTHRQ